MNRIESINTNRQFNTNANAKTKNRKMASTPHFTAASESLYMSKLEQNIVLDTLISKYLGKAGKFFNMLSRTAGEMQNIVIIGLGTAFVAPIFIANNPLSSEDKKSKQYSALRQPISAVIATATSLGINYPIAKWFYKKATEGSIKKFDMSAAPPKEYLKDLYNKVNKRLKKGQPIGKLSKVEKDLIDQLDVSTMANYKIWSEKYPSYQDFISTIHDATKERYAKKLLDSQNMDGLRNISVKDFLIKNLDFKGDDINASYLNPDDLKIKLTDTTAMSFLKVLGIEGLDESTIRRQVGNKIGEGKFDALKNNPDFTRKMFDKFEANGDQLSKSDLARVFKNDGSLSDRLGMDMLEDVNNLFMSSKLSSDNKELMLKRFQVELNKYLSQDFTSAQRKNITRIAELLIPEAMKNEETITLKNLLKIIKFNDDEALDSNLFKNIAVLDMKMDKFLLKIDEALEINELIAHKKGIAIDSVEKLSDEGKLLKYAKSIASNIARDGENALKSYSKVQGIVLSILVLPPACTLLNWAYPRIMDAVFPNLSKSKAQSKGGK